MFVLTPSPQRILVRLAGVVIVLMLQGCALTLANLMTPNSGYGEISTLAYGESSRQSVDVFHPVATPLKPQLLVFFYGGAWEEGSKEDYRFVAQAFTKQGYRVAIPDYRLYPQITFPGFVEDGAAAVATLAAQFPDTPIVLMGHSAGAHIAAMLALNENYLAKQGVDHQRISALVGWSGPYDFLPLTSQTLKAIFPEAQRPDSQPINFVTANAPATLLIHGLSDTRVKPQNSKNLAEKLTQNGVRVTTHYYAETGHIATVGSLVNFFSSWSNSLPDTLAFLDEL